MIEDETSTVNAIESYTQTNHSNPLVKEKGHIKEGDKDLFIQELRAMLVYKRSPYSSRDTADYPKMPLIDHKKFNQ